MKVQPGLRLRVVATMTIATTAAAAAAATTSAEVGRSNRRKSADSKKTSHHQQEKQQERWPDHGSNRSTCSVHEVGHVHDSQATRRIVQD